MSENEITMALEKVEKQLEEQHKILLVVKTQVESQGDSLDSLNSIIWKNNENTIVSRLTRVEELETQIETTAQQMNRTEDKLNQLTFLILGTLISVLGFFLVQTFKPNFPVKHSLLSENTQQINNIY